MLEDTQDSSLLGETHIQLLHDRLELGDHFLPLETLHLLAHEVALAHEGLDHLKQVGQRHGPLDEVRINDRSNNHIEDQNAKLLRLVIKAADDFGRQLSIQINDEIFQLNLRRISQYNTADLVLKVVDLRTHD